MGPDCRALRSGPKHGARVPCRSHECESCGVASSSEPGVCDDARWRRAYLLRRRGFAARGEACTPQARARPDQPLCGGPVDDRSVCGRADYGARGRRGRLLRSRVQEATVPSRPTQHACAGAATRGPRQERAHWALGATATRGRAVGGRPPCRRSTRVRTQNTNGRALLKYADKAKKDPRFTSVYAKTQPKTIFAEDDTKSQDAQWRTLS